MGFDDMLTAQQGILIMLSYMRGNNVAGWYTDLFTETKNINMMFEEFEMDLTQTFQPASMKWDTENELLGLKQKKDQSMEGYFTYMCQLILKAKYNKDTHASLLVHTAWHGIYNEIMEFVERGQPHLLELEHLGKWEKALVHTDNTLKGIASWKSGSSSSSQYFTPWSNYTPVQKAQNLLLLPWLEVVQPLYTQMCLEPLEDRASQWILPRMPKVWQTLAV